MLLITVVIYFSSLFNAFVWDDEQFIYRNEYVATFNIVKIFTTNTIAGAGELSNYYRPLTTLSFAIDYQFWQTNPFGYHLVNIFLHAGAGCILYLLLKRLQFSQPISFGVAVLFLLHPVQTEAVTYINSRGDSLFSFFAFISLLLTALLFTKKSIQFNLYETSITITKPFIFAGIVLTFLASLLSKEIALAVLGLHGLVILRFYFLSLVHSKKLSTSTTAFIKNNWWALSSFISTSLVVVMYLTLRSTVFNFQNTFNFFDDASLYSENMVVRLLTFFKIIFIYIKILVLPFPLHMERFTEVITSPVNPWLVAFLLLTFGLVITSYWQWKKQKKTTILFGWMWAAIMLVPVSGIIAINGMLYEHWLYLPVIGFGIIIVGLIELFNESLFHKKFFKYCLVFLVGVFAILTIRQNYIWGDPVRLYTHLLKYTDSARIHNNLAMAYSERGLYQEALTHYQNSLEYGLPYPQIYHNMGNTYASLGDENNAEKSYLKALELDPRFFHTIPNLINLYTKQQRFDEALEILHSAQSQFPNVVDYDLLELHILLLKQDETTFLQKKAAIEQKSNDPQLTTYLRNLQFSKD